MNFALNLPAFNKGSDYWQVKQIYIITNVNAYSYTMTIHNACGINILYKEILLKRF